MVKLTILIAPSLDVEFSTERDVVSFGDLVAMGVKDAVEVFCRLHFPFGFWAGVANPSTAVISVHSTIVGWSIVVVSVGVIAFAFS